MKNQVKKIRKDVDRIERSLDDVTTQLGAVVTILSFIAVCLFIMMCVFYKRIDNMEIGKGKLKSMLREAFIAGGRYYVKHHIRHDIGKVESFDVWYKNQNF